jgi:hypothetical protein
MARFTWLLVLCMSAAAQSTHRSPETPKLMGREVILYEPAMKDEPGVFPAGPAKVCIEEPPKEQCYTAPKDFGGSPQVEVVQLSKQMTALFFSANGGGVSGWPVHFDLLRPSPGNALDSLFGEDITLSNQSQTAFWGEPALSEEKIFVTANVFFGPGDAHYGEHRYEISVYLWSEPYYWQVDQYVTFRWYDLDAKADVLRSERPEILSRLKRVVPAIHERAQ